MTQSFALISIQRDPEEPVVRFSLPEGTCLWPSRSVSGCYSGTPLTVIYHNTLQTNKKRAEERKVLGKSNVTWAQHKCVILLLTSENDAEGI